MDRNGLEVLDRRECLRLLGAHTFGRVGLTTGALPTVLPVTYRMLDEHIYFRTGPGQKLTAATSNNVIAFEIDGMDRLWHCGWSVCVTGVAREVTSAIRLEELDRVGLPRWTPNDGARVVEVSIDVLSGRRLGAS
jgi:nitroimidazol reductase NimA-like FMN-containing flavoprotein (pyridoxamine 5'-phosphate oxidase superfamily)